MTTRLGVLTRGRDDQRRWHFAAPSLFLKLTTVAVSFLVTASLLHAAEPPILEAEADDDEEEFILKTGNAEVDAAIAAAMAEAKQAEEGHEGEAAADEGEAAAALETEESIARFQQLLQRRPFHEAAFNGLVSYYAARSKMDELVADYVARVESLPDDPSARIVLARLHLRGGDAEQAEAALRALDEMPANPELARLANELLVFRSEVYQHLGNFEAAEEMLTQALAQTTRVADRLNLAEAQADLAIRRGDRERAAEVLRGFAAEFPDNYLHQRHIAEALSERSLNEAAVTQYQAMLDIAEVKQQPDRQCEVLRQLGLSYERLDRRDEAIATYAKAIALVASDHWLQRELHERIVRLYRASNRLDDLAAYCQEQIARAPEHTSMRILLAEVQSAMDDADAAHATLAQAVQLFPADLTLSQKSVELLERLGDVEAVSNEYQRIISQHPDDAELYVSYGQFLASNRQYEAAGNQWRHVLNQVANAALANRLGALFETYELYEDAAAAYERAIALSPDQPDGYVALSRLCTIQGDQEKSVEALRRAGESNPENGALFAALAQAYLNLGLADDALEAITRACELLPANVRFRQQQSDLLVAVGRLEDALNVRRESVDLMPSQWQQAEAASVLVSMYASSGMLPALVESEQTRLQAHPDDFVSLLILARAADVHRDFQAARAWLEKILAIDPANETALAQLAKLFDAIGDVDSAVANYQRLLQIAPARSRQHFESIVDLKLRYADRAGAIDTLEQMAKNDAGSAATLSAVAEQLVRMGEAERAIEYFEKSLELSPERDDTHLDYGKALADAGRHDDAMNAFHMVATGRGDPDRVIEALGRLHDTASQLGELEQLIDDLQKQVSLDPQNTLVARALARILVREFEYSRAMELIDMVMQQNPRDADLALTKAELHRRLAQFDEAMDVYEQVIRFPQIDRDYVLGEMGKTQFEAGQVDQARRLWRQVQNRLYAGTLFRNNGLHDDAVAIFEEGIRLQPNDYALHRNLVGSLEAAGRTEDALNAARRLLDLEPGNVFNITALAEAYLKQGDRGSAAEIAGRLFSSAPGVVSNTPGSGSGSGALSGYAGGGSSYPTLAMAMYQSMYAPMANVYYYSGGAIRSNLDRGIAFFHENGLLAELEEVLEQQMALQPENTLLKQAATNLYMTELNKPERALALLRELETAPFPIEHQQWLGQCSQRDFMRINQYNLIASKPGLRDARLGELESKGAEALNRDELLELAVVRTAQGNSNQAVDLLQRAVQADELDLLARGMLIDTLMLAERFADAEPHTQQMVELTAAAAAQMETNMVERVRRDFVRSLPLEFQLRVTERMLADIARKWSLGQGFVPWSAGGVRAMGALRATITLATIYAETDRIDQARAIWLELAPDEAPDVDLWTMLGDVATLYKQEDAAYEFYVNALEGARELARDSFLQQIYASSLTQSAWYGEAEAIDATFNSVVEAFAKRDSLVQLYDFLRDTDQEGKARRIVEQYKLGPQLIELYTQRVVESAEAFRRSGDDPLVKSVGYFANVCKLAELEDRAEGGGGWDAARELYADYLADFPDELALLSMLSDVAEAQLELEEAIEWEKRVLECKTRLASRARQWAQRELTLTPSRPQLLQNQHVDPWTWSSLWGRNRWSYGGWQNQLDRSGSWMRLARLYIAVENNVAAADAMQRSVAEAGRDRRGVLTQVLGLIRQRQLTTPMLPVLRSLAIYAPEDEAVQLAFAESLEANDRPEVAAEVCERMLRRGVSDLAVLAQVRRKLEQLRPDADGAMATATIESLEQEVAANPSNLRERLRLARAYFYSLRIDDSIAALEALAAEAPNMEEVLELLVEAYTVKGDQAKLIESLRTWIPRISDEDKRRTVRWRLVSELLAAGQNEDAINEAKGLGDARDPSSYARVAGLLHYFGKHAEASEMLEQAGRSQAANMGGWGMDPGSDLALAQSLVLQGDAAGAAEKILAEIDEQSRQMVQYGGMYGMYGGDNSNSFANMRTLLVLAPALADELRTKLTERHAANRNDPQAVRTLMQFHRVTGRPDLAEQLLDQLVEQGMSDQTIMMQIIDRAVRKKDFDTAIKLAEEFITQEPKPQIPPGTPPQYAGMMLLQAPRSFMICKLGDVYWDMGEHDKAFATYERLVDEKVDQTRLALAAIWTTRGRLDQARTFVDEALAKQQVKQAELLQFRAFIAVLDGDMDKAFDMLAEAAKPGGDEQNDPYGFMYSRGGGSPLNMLSYLARETGSLDRFRSFVEERITRDPHDWTNYLTLANTLRAVGQFDEAMAVIERAASNNTIAQQALTQKRSWSEGYANDAEMIALYQQLIDVTERGATSSSSATARGAFGPMGMSDGSSSTQMYREKLAALLWDSGERDRAEKVFLERLNAQDADTHTKLAQAYLERKDFERAEQAYRRALGLDPKHAEALRGLADLAVHQRRYGEALQHMLALFESSSRSAARAYSGSGGSWYSGLIPDMRMITWAKRIASDPEIASQIAAPAADGAADSDTHGTYGRLLLALLAGDWNSLEAELRTRIVETGSVDPLLWTLWANVQQRRMARDEGAVNEAVKAWEFLQRAKQTSIADHRQQLELVLAGKQIKEAAAGSRNAQASVPGMPAGMPAQMMQSMSYYGGWDYGQADDHTSRLAAIYITQGEFEKAERTYLLSAGGYITNTLPTLAQLMWAQGGREAQSDERQRALELMRLHLILTGGSDYNANYSITSYTSMLAEAGQVDEAADLLIRAYRWGQDLNMDSVDASMYGYRGGDQSFEQGDEQMYSQSLYSLLKRNGSLERVLSELKTEAEAKPDDARLAKLILSVEMRDRRWADVSATLEVWRAQRPDDPALRSEQLHAYLQLQKWPEALALIETIKADDPDNEGRWRLHAAFIELMRNDIDAAIVQIQPLIDQPKAEYASQTRVVLAAARQYDLLCTFLETFRKNGELDFYGLDLLWRSYALAGRPADALRVAFEELWNQSAVIRENDRWLRAITRLVREAELAETGTDVLQVDQLPAADRAIITMLTNGAADGVEAFSHAVTAAADDQQRINAQRGLVLCYTLQANVDSFAQAQKVNEELLAALEPRRRSAWYVTPTPTLERRAREALSQYERTGTASVALSGSMAAVLQGFGSNMTTNTSLVTFENLWRAHQRLQRDLLAVNGEIDDLRALMERQAKTFQASATATAYEEDPYAAAMYAGMNPRMLPSMRRSRGNIPPDDQKLLDDRDALLRATLAKFVRFDELMQEIETLGSRVDEDEWMLAAIVCAAADKPDVARQWRADLCDLELARSMMGDAPGPSLGDRWYSWRWSSYNAATQEVSQLRYALINGLRIPADQSDKDAYSTGGVHDKIDQAWELALVDPGVEQRLIGLAANVGPGWGDTQTVIQLLSFHRARKNYPAMIELLERALVSDDGTGQRDWTALLRSQRLNDYLQACVAAREFDRLDGLLEAAAHFSSTLENDVAVARLVLLRLRGDDVKADAMEREILARCQVEPLNPHRIDHRLLETSHGQAALSEAARAAQMEAQQAQMEMMYAMGGNMMSMRYAGWQAGSSNELPTIAMLASAMGVRYTSAVMSDDMTVQRVRTAYQNCGLGGHAARLLELEIAESASPRDRLALQKQRADALQEAGTIKEAKQAATECEQGLLKAIQTSPGDPELHWRLAQLYESAAFGRDFDKAYEALAQARRLDPAYDATRTKSIEYLHRAGRHEEAWAMARAIKFTNPEALASAPTMLFAALSGSQVGAGDDAAPLLRQAHFCYPANSLASNIEELINASSN